MANLDDDPDTEGDGEQNRKKIDRKKILIFLLPALIVIGLAVSFYLVFSKKMDTPENMAYSVVERAAAPDAADQSKPSIFILYDIPEINVQIKDEKGDIENVKLNLNIELGKMEDVKTIEALMPKIIDAVIAHTVELTPEEITGSNGLYWLKEELLYRINQIVSPVVVSNLNFKTFGIEKNS